MGRAEKYAAYVKHGAVFDGRMACVGFLNNREGKPCGARNVGWALLSFRLNRLAQCRMSHTV